MAEEGFSFFTKVWEDGVLEEIVVEPKTEKKERKKKGKEERKQEEGEEDEDEDEAYETAEEGEDGDKKKLLAKDYIGRIK